MTAIPLVPQEIVARLRARLSAQGIDARPVYVVGPEHETAQVEFFTGGGEVWPVVLRLDGDGQAVPLGEAQDVATVAPRPLGEAMEQLCTLFSGCSPRPVPEEGAA